MSTPTLLIVALLVAGAVRTPAAEVVVLESTGTAGARAALDALRRSLPGQALTEYQLGDDRASATQLVQELRPRTPILVAVGALAVEVAREAAPDLTLVFCFIQDPARSNLLGLPNVLGVASGVPIRNQLAAFRAVHPRGVRVGVIHSPEGERLVDEAQAAERLLRLSLVVRRIASDKDLPQTLRSLLKGGDAVDALWLPDDPLWLVAEARRTVFAEALKAGKPVYASSAEFVAEGALVSSGPDPVSVGEQVGHLITRVIAGERGGSQDLAMPRAELVINRQLAEQLKLEIPAGALAAAKLR